MFRLNKILIADDHPLFREALQQAITNHFGKLQMPNCGSFSGLQKRILDHDDTDLIMLDLHMPGAVGFSTLHYLGITHPEIPVAIISANEEPEVVSRAIKYGASGFIPKSMSIEKIIHAIESILDGEIWMPETISAELQTLADENDEFLERLSILTPKQFRVLMMLVEGRTNSEIADESFVTIATVKAHLSEIFKKLEVSNRTQAAMIAATYLEIADPSAEILT